MAIRKFTQIKPSSWDVIEKMLKLQNNDNYNSYYKVPEDANVIYVEIQKSNVPMRRGFCKCGHSYMVKEDNKGNLILKCPECGNDKVYKTTLWGTKRELANIKNFEISGNKVSFIRESFVLKESIIDTELEIKSVTIKDAEATESDFVVINEEYKNYKFKDFISVAPFTYEHLDFYFDYLNKLGYSNRSYSELINLLKATKKCPNLIKDIEKYPYLVVFSSFTNCPDTDSKTTIDDIIDDFVKCPKEYRSLINKMFNRMNPREFSYYTYSMSSAGYIKNRLNIFEFWKTIKTDELKQSMDYIIRHSSAKASDIKNLLEDINRYKFSKEQEKILAKHLLANFVSHGTRTISKFKEKIDFLNTNGFIVSEENLDKRNFNLLRNLEHLRRYYDYSDERVSLFADAFDLNPLTSIQYLDSKRAPSKKLRQEIEEKMDKKYS